MTELVVSFQRTLPDDPDFLSTSRSINETVEVPQVQFLDRVVDVPVAMQYRCQ